MDKRKEQNNVFRALRIVRNMSVKEVAEELLVTPGYINRIENGAKIPSERLLRDYARVLRVPVSTLQLFLNKSKSELDIAFESFLFQVLETICKQDEQSKDNENKNN